ncbi:ankyrin [endosymbiont of Acanthamoeba sp. UWC8]|uniref:ankyrin repeat domain-containing protein n=1 Tax=endosymbiont of Acanthamoeba sp. UWC8 TaxID=86106 RepID=UPI0004D0D033|nr:ankyrin repeat domain-containing protein [endosymbiont of Acanthamoeba sp. UWC8]AIF82062.1 ankyrin [endosymbiont of Acanthamoeba sp. UWC8]
MKNYNFAQNTAETSVPLTPIQYYISLLDRLVNKRYGMLTEGIQKIKEFLESHTTYINIKNSNNFSALHLSSLYGNKDFTKFLIRKGANVNARNSGGETPLHLAAQNGRLSIVRLLIKIPNMNIRARDSEHRTALDLALTYPLRQIELIKANRKVDSLSREPIFEDVAGLLRKAKEYVDYLNNTKVYIVEKITFIRDRITYLNNIFNKTVLILENNPEFINLRNDNGHTVLHLAAIYGETKLIKILLQKGADINAKDNKGKTPQDVSKRLSDFLTIKKYINLLNKIKSDTNNYTKLKVILKTSPELINLRNEDGQTILHIAVLYNIHSQVEIKFLYDLKAKISIRDNEGNTPLNLAKLYDFEEAKKHLINLFIISHNNGLNTTCAAKIGLSYPEYIMSARAILSDGSTAYESELREIYRRDKLEKEKIKKLKERVYALEAELGIAEPCKENTITQNFQLPPTSVMFSGMQTSTILRNQVIISTIEEIRYMAPPQVSYKRPAENSFTQQHGSSILYKRKKGLEPNSPIIIS